ncbi:MAG: hypothetical protein GX345_02880 [Clostridiales bacterium]|nr:hypothetical protein [Clostridiales bacterium]
MANCPKCDYKLRLIDWRPECPKCGVNVLYYSFEEEFYKDAKIAELDRAKVRVTWMRAKASYVGNKLSIAKLALCLLPLLSLFLTQGSIGLHFPLALKETPLNLLGLLSFFTDGSYQHLKTMADSEVFLSFADGAKLILLLFATVVLFALLLVVFQILAFINYKKMSMLAFIASALGFLTQFFLFFKAWAISAASAGEIFIVAFKPWGLISAFSFLLLLILNIWAWRRGLCVEYVEGDLYRLEVAKKLKRGEIKLDDLPQPIYEAEEKAASGDAISLQGGESLG